MRDPEAAPGRGRWSLALRLTILHGISSFLLVLAASLVLFAGLKAGLEQEDDRLLEDMAGVVAQFLDDTPPDFAAIRTEIEREVLARPNERLYARVMDGDLRTVIETPGLSELLDPGVFPVPAGEGCSFVNVRARDGTPYRLGSSFAASGDGVRRILHIAHDLTDDERLIAAYRRGLQALLIPALLVCMAVGYLVARRGLRPLAAISEAAGRVGPEHLDRRIRSAGLPAEISDLARTLDEMLDRLEGSFGRLTRLSGDVAHELRTPVNRMRGEAEVALSRERTPEEYRAVLASSLEECVRLSDLIDRLLFLARAEDPRTRVEARTVEIPGELAALREYYAAVADEAGIRLEVEAPSGWTAVFDPALVKMALANLASNALAATPPGGVVTVSARPEGGGVRFDVVDTGRGIPAADLPLVFDRFHRVDGSRSHSKGGAGLGLAIVKGIAGLHGGRVEIESAEGRGTRVSLILPAPMTTP